MKIAEKKKCKEARKALAQKELNDFRAFPMVAIVIVRCFTM